MNPSEILLLIIGALQGFLTIPLIIRLPFALVDRIVEGATPEVGGFFRGLLITNWIVLGIATMAATAMAWIVFGSQANPALWPALGKYWGKTYFLGLIAYFLLFAISKRRPPSAPAKG